MPYPGWKRASTPLLDHSSIEKLVKAVNKRGITTSEEFRPHLLSNDTPGRPAPARRVPRLSRGGMLMVMMLMMKLMTVVVVRRKISKR
jgi:hypothetical protein